MSDTPQDPRIWLLLDALSPQLNDEGQAMRFLAALDAVDPARVWRPIAEAPRDGTWVLLATDEGVQAGYWGPSYFDVAESSKWLVWAHRSDCQEVDGTPTRFLPLPEPPEGA
jgi:hypothetical protein